MNTLTTFQAQAQVARAGHKKFPYGPELRRLAVEHARAVAAGGGTLRSAAAALGVNTNLHPPRGWELRGPAGRFTPCRQRARTVRAP